MNYLFLSLTIISFVTLIYLSHQNGKATHETSLTLARILSFLSSDKEKLHILLRRSAHIILFFVFSLFFTLTLRSFSLSLFLLAFPFLYSWADEATKVFTPGRHFSWFDVGLNMIGTVLGVLLGVAVII